MSAHVKTKAHVTSSDHGAHAMVERVKKLGEGVELRVGVLEGDADHGEGLTVGELAAIHEFGAPEANIPPRSFIRAWYDEELEQNKAAFREVMRQALTEGGFEGRAERAFARLGALFVARIQARIIEGIDPELKKATIDAKGSSTPLIDTGVLKSSITFEVD